MDPKDAVGEMGSGVDEFVIRPDDLRWTDEGLGIGGEGHLGRFSRGEGIDVLSGCRGFDRRGLEAVGADALPFLVEVDLRVDAAVDLDDASASFELLHPALSDTSPSAIEEEAYQRHAGEDEEGEIEGLDMSVFLSVQAGRMSASRSREREDFAEEELCASCERKTESSDQPGARLRSSRRF